MLKNKKRGRPGPKPKKDEKTTQPPEDKAEVVIPLPDNQQTPSEPSINIENVVDKDKMKNIADDLIKNATDTVNPIPNNPHPNKTVNQPQPEKSVTKPTARLKEKVEEIKKTAQADMKSGFSGNDPAQFPFGRIFANKTAGLSEQVKSGLNSCMAAASLPPDDIMDAGFSGPIENLTICIVSVYGKKYYYEGGRLAVS